MEGRLRKLDINQVVDLHSLANPSDGANFPAQLDTHQRGYVSLSAN
jgi:hypothetical protein